MLSKAEMKEIVVDVVRLGNELRKYYELEDEPAKAGPPPDKRVLDAIAQRFIEKVPPSYLQLMSINNGVKNFEWVDVSILPAEFLLKHGNLDHTWIESGMYREGELFVFALSATDSHVVAFLPKTVSKLGEMEVVHFDSGGTLGQYRDLDEYLRERRSWYAKSVQEQKADRENLKNHD